MALDEPSDPLASKPEAEKNSSENEMANDGDNYRKRERVAAKQNHVNDASPSPQHPQRREDEADISNGERGVLSKKAKKRALHVEAIVHPSCPAPLATISKAIETFVKLVGQSSLVYTEGPLDISKAPQLVQQSCCEVSIVDVANEDEDFSDDSNSTSRYEEIKTVASCNVSHVKVHAYALSDEDPEMEELENPDDEDLTACETLPLPHSGLHTLWDSLILPWTMKSNLLEYAHSSLLFADKNVSPHVISWNRVIFLHGPPGTGKTSLCRALAHKLTIRMSDRFHSGGYLLEIHSHSLFSKWFSESGKLVSKLFSRIREMVEDDPDALICVLVDEVESLAAVRSTGGGGTSGEPSDAIRAVNSLLTSIDRLKKYRNVIVMATTNISGSVDVAFVDRADIKQYVGLPVLEARYEILRSCIEELARVGIISAHEGSSSSGQGFLGKENTFYGGKSSLKTRKCVPSFRQLRGMLSEKTETSCLSENGGLTADKLNSDQHNPRVLGSFLLNCAKISEGLSGRSLRKLPFQSHAQFVSSDEPVSVAEFLVALQGGIQKEQDGRKTMKAEIHGDK